MMRHTVPLLIALSSVMGGCGGASGPTSVESHAAVEPQTAASTLIHSPPIKGLDALELRSLSMECEKYSPLQAARGPYDAAYCEDAMAAWADAPLQMVTIDEKPKAH